jgi:hypothetical protein
MNSETINMCIYDVFNQEICHEYIHQPTALVAPLAQHKDPDVSEHQICL